MTRLSVNLNKIALLRNSRGRDYPNIIEYAKRFIDLGVHSITVHPRQDERHIKRVDVYDLSELLHQYDDVEFNVEGYPSDDFLHLVEETKPDQCTLVPDIPGQLTSDHGWNIAAHRDTLQSSLSRLQLNGIRSTLFMDHNSQEMELVAQIGYDRIELYTEYFAQTYGSTKSASVFNLYERTAKHAQYLGLGVNAGHDLDLLNLRKFLEISNILEVSIGHALTIECINCGIEFVTRRYIEICNGTA